MQTKVSEFHRICICGARENSHTPWSGNCRQFKASGRVEEEATLRYVKEVIPAALRWEIWERDDFRCQWCGSRRFLQVDHINPESNGGLLVLENLQTLCKSCNSKKGNGV
jgi:5-methylcytosine-specific restriction endonuclease McrA